MPADMCEGDDLLGVFSGALINGEIEYPRQNLRGKLVCWGVFVQEVRYASCRGLQHLEQFSNLQPGV